MKKIIVASLVFIFISCKKGNDAGNSSVNHMAADISVAGRNVHISSPQNKMHFNRDSASGGTAMLLTGGVENSDVYISINLYNITSPGSYVFGRLDSGQFILILYSEAVMPNVEPVYGANSDENVGELVIESMSDKQIKGSFKATCPELFSPTEISEITHGSFTGNFN
jgi:hypothetical protein